MKYQYGISQNCLIIHPRTGDIVDKCILHEGCGTRLEYVSNNTIEDMLVAYRRWDCKEDCKLNKKHKWVGQRTNLGDGAIVAVIQHSQDNGNRISAVVFERPYTPRLLKK